MSSCLSEKHFESLHPCQTKTRVRAYILEVSLKRSATSSGSSLLITWPLDDGDRYSDGLTEKDNVVRL
jgi:hypothetical protein